MVTLAAILVVFALITWANEMLTVALISILAAAAIFFIAVGFVAGYDYKIHGNEVKNSNLIDQRSR